MTGEQIFTKIEEARVLSAVATLMACKEGAVSLNEYGCLSREIIAQTARVIGNRRDDTMATWQDVRLMLAATLRECLGKLEETGA